MRNHMDENHQNAINNNLVTTENKIWLPPSFTNGKAPVTLAPKKRGIKWGFANRTGFDWIMLVSQVLAAIVTPFVVTMLGLYFTQQVTQQQTQLSERQHQVDLQIAEDQQRATILQTYIDNIQDLLLNHNLLKSSPFYPSNPYYDVSTLARARTLTALQGLDPHRKGLLLNFLHEAHLIGYIDSITNKFIFPIINLDGADLSNVDLRGAYLNGADLINADLRFADLSHANLDHAFLDSADLTSARLTNVNSNSADLSNANLTDASLSNAFLGRAYLVTANLSHADLHFAILSYADLTAAYLNYADLRDALQLHLLTHH